MPYVNTLPNDVLHRPVVGFTDFDAALNHWAIRRTWRFAPKKNPSRWWKAVDLVRREGGRSFYIDGNLERKWHPVEFWNRLHKKYVDRFCWACGEQLHGYLPEDIRCLIAPNWRTFKDHWLPPLGFMFCEWHDRQYRKLCREEFRFPTPVDEWEEYALLKITGAALANQSHIYVINRGRPLMEVREEQRKTREENASKRYLRRKLFVNKPTQLSPEGTAT